MQNRLQLTQWLALVTVGCLVRVHAQSLSCAAGSVAFIRCYIDRHGYISDILFRSNPSQTTSSNTVCQATQQQLAATSPDDIYLAVGETINSIAICADSGGVRGLVVGTSSGESYSCGTRSTGCSVQDGWSPLGGFAANCASTDDGLKRVLRLDDICWIPNYTPTTTSSSCPPGQGSPGGGIGCKACAVGQHSDSPSGMCVPCPPGSYTLQNGQSSCGCLPGYGTTGDNPNECQPCPAGTYSSGGSMSPCKNCPQGFSPLSGSPSLRFCVCKAGTGLSGSGTCKACPQGYYNPGPLTQRALGNAGTATASEINTKVLTGIPAGDLAYRSAVYEAQQLATSPAGNKCTYCGDGFTTDADGATSKNDCVVDETGTGSQCPAAGQGLYDGVCVCIPGNEPVADGSEDCQLCSAGFFKADPGDIACQPCPSGQLPSSNRTSCVPAPPPPPGPRPPPTPSPRPPPTPSPSPTPPVVPPPSPPSSPGISPSPPTTPSPSPDPGACQNTCVQCDITGLVSDIGSTCDLTDPNSVVFIDCSGTQSDTPFITSNPFSILGSSNGLPDGDLKCAEIKKVTQFSITATDTGTCANQPLTCAVSGYTL